MEEYVSDYYRSQLEDFTKRGKWGGAVIPEANEIHRYCILSDSKSLLDYGSGRSDFKMYIKAYKPNIPYTIHEYEPARPEKAQEPPVCDFTICVDVLEHVEPDKVDNVLKQLNEKTNKFAFFMISLIPSHHYFSDGRNVHLSIHPAEWWTDKIRKDWDLVFMYTNNTHLKILLKKRKP